MTFLGVFTAEIYSAFFIHIAKENRKMDKVSFRLAIFLTFHKAAFFPRNKAKFCPLPLLFSRVYTIMQAK